MALKTTRIENHGPGDAMIYIENYIILIGPNEVFETDKVYKLGVRTHTETAVTITDIQDGN